MLQLITLSFFCLFLDVALANPDALPQETAPEYVAPGTSPNTSSSQSPSGAALAGIIVGTIGACIVLSGTLILIYYFFFHKRHQPMPRGII